MNQLALINPRNVSEEEALGYKVHEAARAVVLDENNLIALLHVARDNYYKLPGGGLEEGEDKIEGLRRECQEEIGCDVEVVKEIGTTLEYWKEDTERQTSYCYLAKVIGEKGTPNHTENEKKRGFKAVWVPLEEAMRLVKESMPTHFEGEYIIPRDIVFLEAVKLI